VTGFDTAAPSYLKSIGARTPVAGLYHIGHWTVQSGVSSVMYSARELFTALRNETEAVPTRARA
jgi:hypothetical protein